MRLLSFASFSGMRTMLGGIGGVVGGVVIGLCVEVPLLPWLLVLLCRGVCFFSGGLGRSIVLCGLLLVFRSLL